MKKNNKLSTAKTKRKPKSTAVSEVLAILSIAFGLIYLVALFSYHATETPWSGDVELNANTLNQAGMVGAYLSDISLSILGYSAYLIPIALIWLGYGLHKNIGKTPNPWSVVMVRFFAFLILLLSTSAFLSLDVPNPLEGGRAIAGGDTGYSIHQYFGQLFGSVAFLIYLSVMMVSFSIASTASWMNIFGNFRQALSGAYNQWQQWRAERKNKAIKKTKPVITPKQTPEPSSGVMAKVKSAKIKPDKKIKKAPTVASSSNLFNTKSIDGLPNLSLLNDLSDIKIGYSEQALEDMSRQVELKLKDFGFDVSITTVTPGPVVTQFEVSLAPGVKVSQIMNLNKDLARALLVESVRIVDVIPGKPVIGIEIPNEQREMIGLREILASDEFIKSESRLTMGLGKDINGLPVVANLAKMPHLLVAGATGMGKSVSLNSIIVSMLYKAKPDEVRVIMIDPKIVELAIYADIPHLLTPVITDMNQAASALWWCVNEMERRYLLLAKFGVRNIDGFNEKLAKAKAKGKPLLDPSFNPNTAEEGETAPELEALPLIMLVIDEYADMLGALQQEDRNKAKRVEALIVRLAQKARAAGIHLIIATQRPSVDVITGLIKSNVPTRVAFKVSSKVDSRTILDQGGAEQLLGMGDMLYMTPGVSHLTRVHGAFVGDDEIARVVRFLKEKSEPNYLQGILNANNESDESHEGVANTRGGELDELYDEAVAIVTSSRRASISSLQRRMRIGYNRAARIIEDMEASGVVSPMNNNGSREVLAPEPITDD